MKYEIEVGGYILASACTKDVAMFIAKTLKSHWKNLGEDKQVRIYNCKEDKIIMSL